MCTVKISNGETCFTFLFTPRPSHTHPRPPFPLLCATTEQLPVCFVQRSVTTRTYTPLSTALYRSHIYNRVALSMLFSS